MLLLSLAVEIDKFETLFLVHMRLNKVLGNYFLLVCVKYVCPVSCRQEMSTDNIGT